MIGRRGFLAGSGAALLTCGRCGAADAAEQPFGCWVTANEGEATGPQRPEAEHWGSSSGNRDFDHALAQTLGKLAETFDVLPGFAFYDEPNTPNAYATSATWLGRADGCVVFGRRLLTQLMRTYDRPAIAVATVCAHEFAHIHQYKTKIIGDPRLTDPSGRAGVKRRELHADYLAGYFTGLRRAEKADYAAAEAAITQYDFGDTDFGSRQHHGTPQERGSAVAAGYAAARTGRSFAQATSAGADRLATR